MKRPRLLPDERNELRRVVLLLRFRTDTPTVMARKYLSYKNISQYLKVPYGTVQHLCRWHPKKKVGRPSTL